jgi:DNA-binding MurR/RpiR family transcriptional regulator
VSASASALPDDSPLHCADPAVEQHMIAEIDRAREAGDTLGGAFEVIATGVPIGLGSYVQWDRKLDGRLAQALMSIPAIKAVGIGIGPDAAFRPGSQVHDEILLGDAASRATGLARPTNNAGGLEGGSLRQSERRVAAFVLDRPEEVLYLSVSELADRSKTSDPTVIRFCRALGFSGFQEFKIGLARQMVPAQKSIHEEAEVGDDPSALVRKVFAANAAAIHQTAQVLDPKEVGRALDALEAAQRVEFYGMGGSGMVALDAYHKFFRLGMACTALVDPHMQAMSAAVLRPGDVAVVISHSGATKDIVESLKVAKGAGATTIGIVSHQVCPVAALSDIRLCCSTREVGFKQEPMSSRIAQLSVVDVLAVGLALRRRELVVENLEKARTAIANKRY